MTLSVAEFTTRIMVEKVHDVAICDLVCYGCKIRCGVEDKIAAVFSEKIDQVGPGGEGLVVFFKFACRVALNLIRLCRHLSFQDCV